MDTSAKFPQETRDCLRKVQCIRQLEKGGKRVSVADVIQHLYDISPYAHFKGSKFAK